MSISAKRISGRRPNPTFVWPSRWSLWPRFLASWLFSLTKLALALVACGLVSTILAAAVFPGELSIWFTLVQVPTALFILVAPVLTVYWSFRASWQPVFHGLLTALVWEDGELVMTVSRQPIAVPADKALAAMQLTPTEAVTLVQDIWGRRKLLLDRDWSHEVSL
jgi:hypothetical protein